MRNRTEECAYRPRVEVVVVPPMTQLEKAREEIRRNVGVGEPYHWRQEALKAAMKLHVSDTLFVNIGNGVFLAWRWDALSETLTYKGSSTNIAGLVDLKSPVLPPNNINKALSTDEPSISS